MRRRRTTTEAEDDAMELVKAIRRADRSARAWRIAAYVLIVVIAAYGFWRVQSIQARQCRDAADNRIAVREEFSQVAALGRGLVKDSPPQRRAALEAQFDAFEKRNLDKYPLIRCP